MLSESLDIGRAFLGWWQEELYAVAAGLGRGGSCPLVRPVLVALFDEPALLLPSGKRIAPERPDALHSAGEPPSRSLLGKWLDRSGPLVCDLAISASDCFVRRLQLPPATDEKLHSMARLDMEQRTPLRTADVYDGLAVGHYDRRTRRLEVFHVIVKAEIAADYVERAQEIGCVQQDIIAWHPQTGDFPPVPLKPAARPPGRERPSGPGRITIALSVLALLLGFSATQLHLAGQAEKLEQIDAAVAERKRVAKTVLDAVESIRGSSEQLKASIDERRRYRPRALLLDEITRLMPDTVWLSDLRIDGDRIEIVGFAPSAAELVSLIDAAEGFADPALAAPVTYDGPGRLEQFRIAFSSAWHGAASRGKSPPSQPF